MSLGGNPYPSDPAFRRLLAAVVADLRSTITTASLALHGVGDPA